MLYLLIFGIVLRVDQVWKSIRCNSNILYMYQNVDDELTCISSSCFDFGCSKSKFSSPYGRVLLFYCSSSISIYMPTNYEHENYKH